MTPRQACSQPDFAAALLDPDLACPPGLTAWNGSDATVRLAVYRNNVVSSLIDALAQTFPVVQELVGVQFFRAMASLFVRQAPPRSRVLAHYGSEFPDFVEQFEPARPVPYLSDVARLELARVRAYHAADAEPVASETVGLAMASADRIGELRIAFHPSVGIVNSCHAVVSLWAAHQGTGDLAAIDLLAAEAAMVLREGLDVLVLPLAPAAAEFVEAVREGHCLGAAASAALGAAATFDLSATLALLLGHGAVTSIHLPGRLSS